MTIVRGSEGAGAKGTFQPGMGMFQLGEVTGFGLNVGDARTILAAMEDRGDTITAHDLRTAAQAGVDTSNWSHMLGENEVANWQNLQNLGTSGEGTTGSQWHGASFIGSTGDLGNIWAVDSAGMNEVGQRCREDGGMEVCEDSWWNDSGQLCSGAQDQHGGWFEQCIDQAISPLSGNGNGNGDTSGGSSGTSNGTNDNNNNNNNVVAPGGDPEPVTYGVHNLFGAIVGEQYENISSSSEKQSVDAKPASKPTTVVSYFDAMLGAGIPAPTVQPVRPVRKPVISYDDMW